MLPVKLLLLSLLLATAATAQERFDPAHTDAVLATVRFEASGDGADSSALEAIRAVDRHYRRIADSLYAYRSRRYTLLRNSRVQVRRLLPQAEAYARVMQEPVYKKSGAGIRQNGVDTARFLRTLLELEGQAAYAEGLYPVATGSVRVLPGRPGTQLQHIAFDQAAHNALLDSLARRLSESERHKLYGHLAEHWDHFSETEKILEPQPVRFSYVVIGDRRYVYAGLDIYGAHFLWTLDTQNGWNVVQVRQLWIY